MDYINNIESRQVILRGYQLAEREAFSLIFSLDKYSATLKNSDAIEFCQKGLTRRVFHIKDCLNRLSQFVDLQLLEKWTNQIPHQHQFELTTILHSFFITLSGGLDNLAWTIAKENSLSLRNYETTLFSQTMKQHLSTSLLAMLDKHEAWLNHIKSFRDPMAHRIPLYVIPFLFDPKKDDEYNCCSPYYAISESDNRLVRLHEQIICDARGFYEIIQSGILD